MQAGYGMYYQDEGLGNQYGAAQSAPFVYSITAITQPGAGRITWSNPFPAASVQKQGFSTRPRDWPVERFNYVGVNDPAGDDLAIAIAGEQRKVQSAERRKLHELGAVGVIAKPFDPLRLANEVAALAGWR